MRESWYVVGVNPTPWTVPNVAIRRNKKTGKPFPQLYQSAMLNTYKKALADELQSRYGPLEVVTHDVALEFYFLRELDTVKTRGGRVRHKNRADATNLQKATEDALQGVLFKNDSQVVMVRSVVVEQTPTTLPAVVIHVVHRPKIPKVPPHIEKELNELHRGFLSATDNETGLNVRDIF